MKDTRMGELGDIIVDYSLTLREGEVVYIENYGAPTGFMEILVDRIIEIGAVPLISEKNMMVMRRIIRESSENALEIIGNIELLKMKAADAYIGIKAPSNISEYSDIDMRMWENYRTYWWKPVHLDERINNTKWVTLRWPTPAMAQRAGMSTEALENFYFSACTMDYSTMSRSMDDLVRLLEKTDTVEIKGPGTDIRFSIKDMGIVKADGHMNLPDGEVFTAPVVNSMNGRISFNVPTIHEGVNFDKVSCMFTEGEVTGFSTSNDDRFGEILHANEGARFVGEFALGMNPRITRPINDIIFDEKMAGSLHLALGNAYPEADNGNRCSIHWDLILNQTKSWGGGEIFFDGELIRKDGIFIGEELCPLNRGPCCEERGDLK